MFDEPRSVRALASKKRIEIRRAFRGCHELEDLGWLRLVREGIRLRPVALVPHNVESRIAAEIDNELRMAPFKGEGTAKAFIGWIVAPRVRLIHNARPSILENPETRHNLEYDIFAPEHRWATEYQGDQHFGPTQQYPGLKEFADRNKRDRLKARLSKKNGIRVTEITKEDLNLAAILEAIPADIPRRSIDPKGPVIETLERQGKEIAGRQDWDRE